ncbi:hypothetical protein R1flu_009967 [Riccia fluitans]|uniref:Uncharacterized protein n=1 Tax=Riccia fluitans TaxID=41844 RepID=A0ABD1Z4F9_9MARC
MSDVSNEESRVETTRKGTETFNGKLDILVNNVGTNLTKPTVDFTPEDYHFLCSTDLESAFRLNELAFEKCWQFLYCERFVCGRCHSRKTRQHICTVQSCANQMVMNLGCE